MTEGGGIDRNWNALLKWSLAQTDDGNTANVTDGTGDARPPPRVLSEEDKKWLLEAMKNGVVDEIKRMKEITQCLAIDADQVLPTREDVEARLELMQELNDRVCSIDNGGDLHTIGGLAPVVASMASPHAEVRAAAAEILSTTVQNHPKAQLAALECDAMVPLVRLVTGQGEDATPKDAARPTDAPVDVSVSALLSCRVKALLSVSSLTRGCPLAVAKFIEAKGMDALRVCVEEEEEDVTPSNDDGGDIDSRASLFCLRVKSKTKALVAARHLCVMSDAMMGRVVAADLCPSAGRAIRAAVPSFGKLGGSWSDAFRAREKTNRSADSILASQLREAALRFLLDVARCVDFEATPKALDDLRGALVVDALNTLGRWYMTFDDEEKETHMDEMAVCAELTKMFG
jgi:hsp70-interacting protein